MPVTPRERLARVLDGSPAPGAFSVQLSVPAREVRLTVAGAGPVSFPAPDPGTAQSIAWNMLSSFGFDPNTQFSCLNDIYTRESGWRWNAANASGAYGIPQALPGPGAGGSGKWPE